MAIAIMASRAINAEKPRLFCRSNRFAMNLEYPKKSAYYCIKVHCMMRFLLAFFCITYLVNDCIGQVVVGADHERLYMTRLQSKRIALVVNQTSRKGNQHLVDALWDEGLDIGAIFAPEHGFRGDADAGERVADASLDSIPVYSLYGSSKKPSAEQLEGIDLVVFDIQDVGVRFYTYISTMTYVMEACAELDIPVIVFDRPNPFTDVVDGPTLDPEFSSFVGLHEVPVIYGMTIGEYALMVKGEGWIKDASSLDLRIVPLQNYRRNIAYSFPVKPSPNLPNMHSIGWYPSLCFFEGTVVSVGRGTNFPFQVYGHPDLSFGDFSFTPKPNGGSSWPKLNGQSCQGKDFRSVDPPKGLDLSYLHKAYHDLNGDFFLSNNFIDLLYGSDALRTYLKQGKSVNQIRATWQEDLEMFKSIRAKYLLY